MTGPSRLLRVGVGRELAYGDGAAPSLLVACDPPQLVDNNPPLGDGSWRGAPAVVFGHEPGLLDSTLQLSGPVMADTVGVFLAGVLGDVQFTAGTVNEWALALLNSGDQQPPSYAVWLTDTVGPLLWAGGRVASLGLRFAPGELLSWQAQLAGRVASVPGSVSMPGPSAEPVLPGWVTVFALAGVADVTLLEAEVSFARDVTAKWNVNGAQAPWLQRANLLDVSGSLSFAVRSDALRQQFVAGSSTSIDLACVAGSGAGARGLRVHCSDVTLTAASRSYGARWVEFDTQWEANATAADAGASGGASPALVTVTNNVPFGTY